MSELFRSVADQESVGFGVIEPIGDDFVFVFVSPALQALEPSRPMSGSRFADIWPDQLEFASAFARVIGTGEAARAEDIALAEESGAGEHPAPCYTLEVSRLRLDGRSYLLVLVWQPVPEPEPQAGAQAQRDLETTRKILAGARSLTGMLELPELHDRIARSLLTATNIGRVIVNLWNPERSEFVVTASAGHGRANVGRIFSFAQFSDVTRQAVAEKRTVVVDYDLLPVDQKRYPVQLEMRQALFVPLLDREEFVGFVSLDDPGDRHEFSQREMEIAEGIAGQAATAITNARLVEAVRESARLERSMADISADLASSLDIEETLPKVLDKMCAELHCHGAAVADRVSGGWRIRHVVGLEDEVLQTGNFSPDAENPMAREVLNTKQPYVCPACSGEMSDSDALARFGGFQGFALHPLIVRGDVIGLLMVFFSEPQTLSPGELDFIQRIAFATSLAEENCRLYESEHRIAETLQTALLALPERLPGIDFAHLYRSATEAARVGGDFYDLFEFEHEMVGITVGDMSGHGVDAAVLTSLVKNAIRTQAMQGGITPNAVMATTSRLLYQNSSSEIFATVFFGLLDLGTGRLVYCNAGHTTGALVSSDGRVRRLPGNGPLVGAFDSEDFGLSTESVQLNDVLFLYTDGLTEAWHERERFGEKRLFELLEGERDAQAATMLQHVLDNVLEFSEGQLSDDLAILTLQRSGDL